MDVVGGVIVAADHKDRAAAVCSGRRMKRGRCGEVSYDGAMAMVKKKTTVTTTTTTTKKSLLPCVEEDVDYLHEDYELRSVLSLYRPAIVKPARSWVDPLRFLLKKELTTTDVGDLGRIILPKRDAECQLPHLDNKEGKSLSMEDYNSNRNWTLRYKWWPNNKSRMYVLESTGEFVKYYDLKEKDELIVYKDGVGNLVIRGQKWSSSPLQTDHSFLGPSGLKGMTPTGKRSPKGRSNLSKASSPTNSSLNNNFSAVTTNSVLPTSAFTTSSGTSRYGVNVDQSGSEIVGALGPICTLGPIGALAVQSDHRAVIDWEKLPDPLAIEFSDPPVIEFPGEFECTWGDCI